MKSRKELMLLIIELNLFAIDCRNESNGWDIAKYPELTASWLEEKFDRFYLVETVSNREEDFTVSVELRYKLRSQEKRKYGDGHQVFYDGFLKTTSIKLEHLADPEAFKKEYSKYRDERIAERAQEKVEDERV